MPGERLTEQDRRTIAAGLRDGLTYAAIARRLGRPTSTVTREVTRNGGARHYYADRAQEASRRAARRPAARPDAPGESPGRGVTDVRDRFEELFAHTGLPRMAARVLAALLTTESGGLTSAQLVKALRVSPASVSKSVGYLEGIGTITRERDPGRRAERYVADADAWFRTIMDGSRVDAQIAAASADGALALGTGTAAGARLDKLGRFLRHVSEDLTRSAEHWHRVIFGGEDATGATGCRTGEAHSPHG